MLHIADSIPCRDLEIEICSKEKYLLASVVSATGED